MPTNRQPRSILDFFGSSASASSASASASTSQPKKTELPTSSSSSSSPLHSPLLIYCDGACAANGRRGAKAGYGVSVWSNGVEIEALSKPLAAEEPQTNQRAELRGLQVALEKAMASVGGAEIHTDSKYALDCLQAWAPRWAANGWRKADGQAVLHQDILKPMWATWKSRGAGVRLFHVSAHTGRSDAHSRGNARADELATGAI
jgi:ribonuclease HI